MNSNSNNLRVAAIPRDEVRFEPTSGLDDVGSVFRWRDGIYRGITARYADLYSGIFSSALGKQLTAVGLVPTEISELTLEGYALVLKHKKMPMVSYPSEWCTAMLKDAALLTCNLQEKLLREGFTLKDAHPWNVLFDGGAPRFIDIGSIVKTDPRRSRPFLKEFRSTFLYPLLLMQSGLALLANSAFVVHLGIRGLSAPTIFRAIRANTPIQRWLKQRFLEYRINQVWKHDPIGAVHRLRQQLLAIPEERRGADFDGGDVGFVEPTGIGNHGRHGLAEVLRQNKPGTVLVIGIGNGQDVLLAAAEGARVIAADIDDARLNGIYRYAGQHHLKIDPVRMDINAPNVVHGPWGMFPAAEVRFQSDMVLLMSLAPRLIRQQLISFGQVAGYLSAFSRKVAVVHFDSRRWKGADYWEAIHRTEYRLDVFQQHLSRHFAEVRVVPNLGSHCSTLICYRKCSRLKEKGSFQGPELASIEPKDS